MVAFTSVLFLMLSSAMALTVELPIDELLDLASDIAIVKITDGKLVERGERSCGSIYTARVTENFKGATDSVVQFGNQDGLEIGKIYLVVLNDKKAHIEGVNSLFGYWNHGLPDEAVRMNDEQWGLCQRTLPDKMVAGFGMAAMPIEQPSELGYRTEAVKVPSDPIWLPSDIKCTKATDANKYDRNLGAIWVEKEEMIRLIKKVISRPAGTKLFDQGRYPHRERDCRDPIKLH